MPAIGLISGHPPAEIPASHRDLAECPPLAALTTVTPAGYPQTSVVWCDFDGQCLRVNTMRGFAKERNMRRNPRVTLLCYDPGRPLRYLEVRGMVTGMTEAGATAQDPGYPAQADGHPGRLRPAGLPAAGRSALVRAPATARVWGESARGLGAAMNIAYYHASKFGNGAMVAEEFKRIMAARDVYVSVQHVRNASPRHLPAADLYVFSSPGRIGKPKGDARRFLRNVRLAPGTRYAVLTTQAAPRPDKKTGQLPTQEEQDRYERVIPIMNELLQAKGLTKVAEGAVLVTGMKGPLEDGWREKVAAFADQVTSTAGSRPG